MIGLIRVELRCTHHDWDPLRRFKLSHDRICNFNVSILRIGVLMFHLKNRHIKVTNPVVRKLKSAQWVPIMMCATHLNPNQPSHYFSASTVRARERQTRAPKKGILRGLGRGSYPAHVTVYPYNGYIRGTNPITRHVMSLTCTLKRMRANQCTPKHAATQPLHDSNARARAPNLVTS